MPPTPTLIDAGELRRLALDAGLDAVGFTSAEPFVEARSELERRRDLGLHGGMAFTYRNPARSTDPRRAMEGAATLVVAALAYVDPVAVPAPDAAPQGRVAKYAWTDHYQRLRAALGVVADELRAHGWRALVLADDNALVDRAAAHRAGLGWFGKNANLLLPGQGSWFVLGSVLTDAPLDTSDAPVPDGCGPCTRCLDGCPTAAIVSPGVVDARRCLAWLVQAAGTFPHEHREALGDRIYGCDDCQEVCPPNRRAIRLTQRSDDQRAPEPVEAWVSLLDLLETSDDELLRRHGRWYIPRREPAYLRRNALLALANTARPDDERVIDAVSAALADPNPVVRGHAVWAARRLGRPDLCRPLADDPDPTVQAELAAPPPASRAA